MFRPIRFINLIDQVNLTILRVNSTKASNIRSVNEDLSNVVRRDRVTTHVLTGTRSCLALVINTIILRRKGHNPISFRNFFRQVNLLKAQDHPRLNRTICCRATTFIFFLFTRSRVLTRNRVMVNLAINNLTIRLRVTTFRGNVVDHNFLTPCKGNNIFSYRIARFFRLYRIRHVHVVKPNYRSNSLTNRNTTVTCNSDVNTKGPYDEHLNDFLTYALTPLYQSTATPLPETALSTDLT